MNDETAFDRWQERHWILAPLIIGPAMVAAAAAVAALLYLAATVTGVGA